MRLWRLLMDKGIIKVPKELTEALKRLEYKFLFNNREPVVSVYRSTPEMIEFEEIPVISDFIASGDNDDVLLFQYLTLMVQYAYDDDDKRKKIDEHLKMFLKE